MSVSGALPAVVTLGTSGQSVQTSSLVNTQHGAMPALCSVGGGAQTITPRPAGG